MGVREGGDAALWVVPLPISVALIAFKWGAAHAARIVIPRTVKGYNVFVEKYVEL